MTTTAPTAPASTAAAAAQPSLNSRQGVYGQMSEGGFALLRFIEVNGPQTAADACRAHHSTPRATVRQLLSSLHSNGNLGLDTSTKEPMYYLASKGRAKLADPYDKARKPNLNHGPGIKINAKGFQPTPTAPLGVFPARPKSAERKAFPHAADVRSRPVYVPTELMSSLRPGSNDAFALPSRINDRLRYRSGIVTNMNGDLLS